MEKASIIFSILTHDYGFMMIFWGMITLPVAMWNLWHFRSRKELTEKELIEISPHFADINVKYVIFGIFLFGGMMGVFIYTWFPKLDDWSLLNYGIRFYPSSVALSVSYGIYQGLFAILSGVYPMGKSLSYVYDVKSRIRRVGMYHILISIAAAVFVVLFFFATI